MDYVSSESTGFNPAPPTFMHVDLNSCFATVEQQANPLLRGKPVAVAAYSSGGGCILAASVEAKRLGVKTGLRVRDGKALCPNLIVLPSDPWKYRFVNRKLLALFQEYSADVEVKSIDEMVLNLANSPFLEAGVKQISMSDSANRKDCHIAKPARPAGGLSNCYLKLQGRQDELSETSTAVGNITIQQFNHSRTNTVALSMMEIGRKIKQRIRAEIGDWLTVSVGIAPNRFLAKTASGLHKPDGLDVITGENIEAVFKSLELEDICGIKNGYGGRLRLTGIDSAIKFYRASISCLRSAFRSIVGYHWWLRLHGWEADDREFARKSFGHSHALYEPYPPDDPRLAQILCQLVIKMGRRLRRHGYAAGGIHLGCLFSDYSFWHRGRKLPQTFFADTDLYRSSMDILSRAPDRPVRLLAVSCFSLVDAGIDQLQLFHDDTRKQALTQALDKIADRWGDFMVTPARMLSMKRKVLDRIAFGSVKDLEEFTFQEPDMSEL